ncbi:MAG TPA: long-chain fatty acid--CoA ligase [Anaerolineae bacterium]|nr:long-chain fatty acid--CoA ligase [Anaerolineae bacterium]
MRGTMMDYPLTLQHFLERSHKMSPKKEIASKTATGMHRYTYADFYARVHRLANALADLGVRRGDRVATFAWNHYRHLELYFAIPCMGAVLHTLNIRLFPDQLVYVINHAEDKIIFVDATLLPALQRVQDQIKHVERFVIMTDTGEVPETTLSPTGEYESLLSAARPEFPFPKLDELDAAGMCYTSGTTGNPKGVVYTHRAIFIHSFAEAMADSLAVSERDTVMPVVPMFHVNAWGLPFTGTMVGAKQVFPGPHLQPRDLAELIQNEKVTLAAGVPTLWIGLYSLLEREQYDLSSLRTLVVGGSAAPRTLIENFEKNFGVPITHAWGMTEMTPLGTVSKLKAELLDAPEEVRFAYRAKQGRAMPGVEVKVVDEAGQAVAWDGRTMGELWVRGPWIASSYYNDPNLSDVFAPDGWFRTGDVVTLDPEGYMEITDRTKDLVKSGGEWISSVALESALMGHPKVLEAAVIAIPHEKWQERPMAVVVPKPDQAESITKDELIEFLRPKFAKFWLPDDLVFIKEMPKTSVGKFDKKVLRERFKEHRTSA